MESKFRPAIAAFKSGNLTALKTLLQEDPSLATARSAISHPTLLQCLVLDYVDLPNKLELTQALIDAGAEIEGPMVAAASINNFECLGLLLRSGAHLNGTGGWSPLEEALYWGHREAIALLLEHGATIHNLRLAAGLGRIDLIESFFNSDGGLQPAAGKIDWPFGQPQQANLSGKIKDELSAKVARWSNDSQEIINNAFIYACMENQIEAAQLLLQKGAEIDAIPPGFDYSGTGLHYAALRGHKPMVEFLIANGADVNVRDTKVHNTAAGWADFGGHSELKMYLDQIAGI